MIMSNLHTVTQKITEDKVICPTCNWEGTVADAEPDVDDDGSLGCPRCLCVVMHRLKL